MKRGFKHALWVTALTSLIVLTVPAGAQTPASPDLDVLQHQLDQLKADKDAAAKKAADDAAEPQKPVVQETPVPKPVVAHVPDKHPPTPPSIEPQMVVIPAGRFTMGSSVDEVGRFTDEGPQHPVSVRSFLLAKDDVTRGEFAAFVQETGYKASGCYVFDGNEKTREDTADWRNPGFEQTDRHPVVCVSHSDAEAYIQWYSHKTGRTYRLPTEAEWEYAARAGTTTSRFWGDDMEVKCRYANGLDQTAKARFPELIAGACHDGFVFTSPVGSFPANPWGLDDMLGNVNQWTADCWNNKYVGAPADGSAWMTGDCTRRVYRGGSWRNLPRYLRSASRDAVLIDNRSNRLGFRLARSAS